MMPSQIVTIGGAALAGVLLQRRGITFTGTVLLAVTGLGLFASAFMELDTPIWVAMLIMCVYAGAAVGAGVALTNAIMNLAPAREAGSAASYRSAASNLGSAVGVALMTAVVFGAASASLQEQARLRHGSGHGHRRRQDVRGGATSEASSQFAVPIDQVDQIDDMQRAAYMEGFQAQGWVGGIVTMVASLMFFIIRRRQEAGCSLAPSTPKSGRGRLTAGAPPRGSRRSGPRLGDTERRPTRRRRECRPMADARERYDAEYARSLTDPDGFWLDAAAAVDWIRKPSIGCDGSDAPFFRWFPDGALNTCYNALDRHVIAGRADQPALIYDSR